MKFKLVSKKNPIKPQEGAKWYANPINQGMISKTQISKDIEGRSSLTRGDIANVIENLLDELPKYLVAGNSVKLGDFGSFRLTISSKGVEKPDQYNPARDIKGVKVIFTPGVLLKKELGNIHYEREK